MNLPFRVFVFHHRPQIGNFEVCDLTSVTCDVNFFTKSLPVAVRVDQKGLVLKLSNHDQHDH